MRKEIPLPLKARGFLLCFCAALFLGIGAILVCAGFAVGAYENQEEDPADQRHKGDKAPCAAAARIMHAPP